ncbi:MAG: tetratricopeptide repeat protein [Crocinitomicaceae bacterium]|nr:tetratricopeptide repeat protein [Crocinitomicaceae bacterium]
MRYLFLLIFISGAIPLFSQDLKMVDSLTIALKSAKDLDTKDKIIGELFWEVVYSNPMEAVQYAEMQKKLFDESKDYYYMSGYYNKLGTVYYLMSEMDTALYLYKKKIEYDEKEGDLNSKVGTLFNIGTIYQSQGEYGKARDAFDKVLALDLELKDTGAIISDYDIIGVNYFYQEDFVKAEEYLFKAYKMIQETGNEKSITTVLVDIGELYREQHQLEKALKYLLEADKIVRKGHNKQEHYTVLNNMALIYDSMGDIQKAIDTHKKAIKIAKEGGYDRETATSMNNIGYIFMMNNQPDSALVYLFPALEIKRESSSPRSYCLTLSNIGNSYQKKKMYSKAIQYFQEGIEVSREYELTSAYAAFNIYKASALIDNGNVLEAAKHVSIGLELANAEGNIEEMITGREVYARVLAGKGDYRRAFYMYKEFHEMSDSLFALEKADEVAKANSRYESQIKEQKIELLNQENKIKDDEILREQEINKRKTAENQRKQIMIYGSIVGIILVLIAAFVSFKAYRTSKRANQKLSEKNAEIQEQKEIVEEKNAEILDSITYAKRLQEAILPQKKVILKWLPNSFVLYKPKDIVAGDFYWMENVDDTLYIAAADCTGHGVPGAMVSVVCSNALTKTLLEEKIKDTGKILDRTRELVTDQFGKSSDEIKDGMDVSLAAINFKTMELNWSGAHNPIWIIRKGEKELEGQIQNNISITKDEKSEFVLHEIKADKQPVGKYDMASNFNSNLMKIEKEDTLYLFSDGYADQFGGEKNTSKAGGKKFKSANFKKLLLSLQSEPMEKQRELINDQFEQWRGDLEQVDDVCVIGVRV